jgi:Family of unknown function (DUF6077)
MEARGGTRRLRPQPALELGEAQAELPGRGRPPEALAEGRLERASQVVTRSCDHLLDFLVLALAAWTAIYHVCLVLHVGTFWAAVAEGAALIPCAWLAFRSSGAEPRAPTSARAPAGLRSAAGLVLALNALAAVGTASLFAFTSAPWQAVWPLWLAAAGMTVMATGVRLSGGAAGHGPTEAGGRAFAAGSRTWPATAMALTWAVGLAVFSLFLVRPDGDDALYLRFSSWVAAHGEFPLRDILFTDQIFPAIIYPPLASIEGLAGTVARETGLAAANVVYLGLGSLASALAVLAVWRLLRNWGVRMVGLSLSVTMVFLLLAAEEHRMLGNFFIARMWQGKVVFLAAFIPLLFVLMNEYAERPTGRALVLLAAAGAAGIGLTSTAAFVVPVVAAGCLVPLVRRSPRLAAIGFAAAAGYPLTALVVNFASGGRRAAVYSASDVVAGDLVRFVLGTGVLALVGVSAVLLGPALIRRRSAAQMTATTVLLVGLLFAPPLPLFVFDVTGIGRVLWRWTWALPTAALVGVLATEIGARARSPALRVLPAAALCALLAIWGKPLWAGFVRVADEPAWKRFPKSIEAARGVVAEARPGETILAPVGLSRTLLIMSGTTTAVSPRGIYTRALSDVPGGHARKRIRLQRFARRGFATSTGSAGRREEAAKVKDALRVVEVDLACLNPHLPDARRLLLGAGWSPVLRSGGVSCFRRPEPGAPGDR